MKRYLITGGAGFIGSNLTKYLIDQGSHVTVFDNLSRRGTDTNLQWLQETLPKDKLTYISGDIRNSDSIKNAVRNIDCIVHLAAQVAVTTSVTDPKEDFDINALGTFNVLEAARAQDKKPHVIYTSTNKVYGGMEEVKVVEGKTRYSYEKENFCVPESIPLDFHSPYGCSKGTGDQYVRDYARIYSIPTTVLRMSCIYGTRQFGIEDQGWLAWMAIACTVGKNISIYGDGKQVRDILFVEDLIRLIELVSNTPEKSSGEIFNVGGGLKNTISVWSEYGPMLEKELGRKIAVKFSDWRAGDQRIYVSDISKVKSILGWEPKVNVETGIHKMVTWIKNNPELFNKFH